VLASYHTGNPIKKGYAAKGTLENKAEFHSMDNFLTNLNVVFYGGGDHESC
jgi:hypothetical protein